MKLVIMILMPYGDGYVHDVEIDEFQDFFTFLAVTIVGNHCMERRNFSRGFWHRELGIIFCVIVHLEKIEKNLCLSVSWQNQPEG